MQAEAAGNDALLFAVVLGLLIGVVCAVMGRYGRQLWLLVWGCGLVLISLVYLSYHFLYYGPF